MEPGGSSAATPRRRGGNFYLPAATASWRLRLLRTADMSDAAIASIKCATSSPFHALCSWQACEGPCQTGSIWDVNLLQILIVYSAQAYVRVTL